MVGPGGDATAARVSIRIDVDGDAEEVIGDLAAAVAVRVAKAAERARPIHFLALRARLANALLDAAQGGGDLLVDVHPESHELHAQRLRRRSLCIHRREIEPLHCDAAVVLDAVANGSCMARWRELTLLHEAGSLQEILRLLQATPARGAARSRRIHDRGESEAKSAECGGEATDLKVSL